MCDQRRRHLVAQVLVHLEALDLVVRATPLAVKLPQ